MATRSIEFHRAHDSVAQPPSAGDKLRDKLVRWVTLGFAWSIIGLGTYIVLQVAWTSRTAVSRFGLSLLANQTWDSNRELFGLVPAIWGTLYSSLIGLAIGTFFGL